MKKTEFNGYIYDFSVDYDATDLIIFLTFKYLIKKTVQMKIFCFAKKVFFIGLTILSGFTNANSLGCISIYNQECKTRPQLLNVNRDKPVFFRCSANMQM